MTQSLVSTVPACFVFNGDADGLISQHLVELSGTTPAVRVTGLKREIVLLERLSYLKTASLYVFDISLNANRTGLMHLLESPEIRVTWFDHHEAGDIPVSPKLETHILNAPGTCTALVVHSVLPGSDPRWAAMASFGDNVPQAGEALLRPLRLADSELAVLRDAGELLNYNAYGETGDDVLFHPREVAERMSPFQDPVEFIHDSGLFEPLHRRFREDESHFQNLAPQEQRGLARIYWLPAEPWARRYGATFVNRIARKNHTFGVAVLHPLADGCYQVSVRAPRVRKAGVLPASDFAREFPTGGGRALAAGINSLPAGSIEAFTKRFLEVYG